MNPALVEGAQRALLVTGRALLGLYFLIPGITKVTGYAGTAEYMAAHGVPIIGLLLPLTILLQIGGGLALIAGFRTQLVAFVFAGLTLVISIFMHDFWSMDEGQARAHELQNFIKNLAIMAGLMYVAGSKSARTPAAD